MRRRGHRTPGSLPDILSFRTMTILTMLSLTHLASFDPVPSQDAGRVQELVGSLGQDEIRVYFSPNLESGQTLVGGSRW